MTDKTPEELEVLDYADRARAIFGHWESLQATGWDDDEKLVEALRDLSESVDALRASRAPKGVKPEEVEPGTRVRFDPQNSCHGGKVTFTLLGGKKNATRFWLSEEGNFAFEFDANDRIIPIEEEAGQECEHE